MASDVIFEHAQLYTDIISRPTPRLLSFALRLEWINSIYNTIHSRHCRHSTHCVECYRPHASVGTTTPVQSIASTSMVENCHKYAHENAVKTVNKRPHNLLNKIQNEMSLLTANKLKLTK